MPVLQAGKIQQPNPAGCSSRRRAVSLAPRALTGKSEHQRLPPVQSGQTQESPFRLKMQMTGILCLRLGTACGAKYCCLTPAPAPQRPTPIEALPWGCAVSSPPGLGQVWG